MQTYIEDKLTAKALLELGGYNSIALVSQDIIDILELMCDTRVFTHCIVKEDGIELEEVWCGNGDTIDTIFERIY